VRYQDLKIRDIGRLITIGSGLALIVALSFIFRGQVEPIVDRFPSKSAEPFVPIMLGLAIVAVLCFVMVIYYLWSSPAQNAAYMERMKATGRDVGNGFDRTLLDPSDPDYEVRTWIYMKRRFEADR
jgi:hypothetical protein